jgi:hypothetical protein
MSSLGATLLARALAFDLPATPWRPPAEPLDAPRWNALLTEVHRLRASGPLTAAVVHGAWPTTDEQRHELALEHRASMALAVHLEQHLVVLHHELAAAGIGVVILKGPAIAHLDEADPSRRAYGDLDLLTRGDDFASVTAHLEQRGGRRRFAEPTRGFDRRFSKGASFSFDENLEVDLHRTLCPGPFGFAVHIDQLWEHTEGFRVADHELRALDRPGRFLHACIHALLGQAEPRPPALRDLVLTAPRDRDELLDALSRGREELQVVVRDGVLTAAARLGWAPPRHLAHWCRTSASSPRTARWLWAYQHDRRSSARLSLASVAAIDGLTNKIAYAQAVALPRHHRLHHTRRWRSGLSGLRRPART